MGAGPGVRLEDIFKMSELPKKKCKFKIENKLALFAIWEFELRAGTGFMGPIWGKNRIFRAQILNNFEAVFILNISICEKKISKFFQNKKNSTS